MYLTLNAKSTRSNGQFVRPALTQDCVAFSRRADRWPVTTLSALTALAVNYVPSTVFVIRSVLCFSWKPANGFFNRLGVTVERKNHLVVGPLVTAIVAPIRSARLWQSVGPETARANNVFERKKKLCAQRGNEQYNV